MGTIPPTPPHLPSARDQHGRQISWRDLYGLDDWAACPDGVDKELWCKAVREVCELLGERPPQTMFAELQNIEHLCSTIQRTPPRNPSMVVERIPASRPTPAPNPAAGNRTHDHDGLTWYRS